MPGTCSRPGYATNLPTGYAANGTGGSNFGRTVGSYSTGATRYGFDVELTGSRSLT